MLKKNLILLILSFVACSCYAQTIRPGDALIDYTLIRPAHQFYKNITWDTLGNVKYEFMMEDVINIDSARHQVIFSRSRQIPPGSFSMDTSVTDFFFRPVSMHEVHVQQKRTYEMKFAEGVATVRKEAKGVVTNNSYPMKGGYFEDNMIEYIFGYLKLQKGVTYTMDNFNEATPGNDPYTIKYAFDDSLGLPGYETLNCTVLAFTHGSTNGYIWIDKRTHTVIKKTGQFKTGTYVILKR